ncbi:MAG TPA: hypothetical protein VNE39_23085 [Planctomycetota bacterium]|nr:hypothetical protein [Planctomycetota bacterium]
MARTRWTAAGLALGAALLAAQAADVTTVRITDQVLVPDTIRLGINTCGDNYWDSSIVKTRVAENFEGVRYRMITWGPEQDGNGLATWFSPPREAFEAMKGTVKYRILGGPGKGTTGLIRDFGTRKIKDGRELTYIVLDKKVPASQGNKNGLLLELERLDQGCIGETSNPAFWNAEQNTACIGDIPPGSFGQAALWLKGSEESAHYTFVPIWANQIEPNGTWRVQFWAKAKAGEPTLRLSLRSANIPAIQPDAQWRKQDLHIEVKGWPEKENSIAMRFEATGGDVLLDDIVIWKEEQDRNPTPFRDTLVDVLKRLRPGILRHLQMGGSDLETNLRPRLQQVAWSRDFRNLLKGARNKAQRYDFNLHDYYLLCEHVGADPWYCLPGTLHPEEIPGLMEYLGGGLNIVNDALLMMREKKIRSQCLFNLNQKQFYEGIKLWGFCPGLSRTDQRYRPVFLATQIANKVIGGGLVATEHSGAKPTFSATGLFEDTRKKGEATTYESIPTLWSHAFRKGARRGLLLVNLDTARAHPVAVTFSGSVKDRAATAWWLTAEDIGANNEYETGQPQVVIREDRLTDFASGKAVSLPPFSMVALQWSAE